VVIEYCGTVPYLDFTIALHLYIVQKLYLEISLHCIAQQHRKAQGRIEKRERERGEPQTSALLDKHDLIHVSRRSWKETMKDLTKSNLLPIFFFFFDSRYSVLFLLRSWKLSHVDLLPAALDPNQFLKSIFYVTCLPMQL
jgi:hypothetical protein